MQTVVIIHDSKKFIWNHVLIFNIETGSAQFQGMIKGMIRKILANFRIQKTLNFFWSAKAVVSTVMSGPLFARFRIVDYVTQL